MPTRTSQRPAADPGRFGRSAATNALSSRTPRGRAGRSAPTPPAGRFGRPSGGSPRRSGKPTPSRRSTSGSPFGQLLGGKSGKSSKGGKGAGGLLSGLTGALGGSSAKRGRGRSSGGGKGRAAGGMAALAGLAGLALKNRDKLPGPLRGSGKRQDDTFTVHSEGPGTPGHGSHNSVEH